MNAQVSGACQSDAVHRIVSADLRRGSKQQNHCCWPRSTAGVRHALLSVYICNILCMYVCAVDVTGSDEHIELIKASLLAMLEGLPQHAAVMLLTFAHDVSVVDMRESVPHFLHVSVGSDGFCDVALADVLPVVDLAVPVATHSACIAAAINAIFPSSSTNPHTQHSSASTQRSFGPAMAALMQLQVVPLSINLVSTHLSRFQN